MGIFLPRSPSSQSSADYSRRSSEEPFLTVRFLDVAIKRLLQSFYVFSLFRAVMRRCHLEESPRT